MSLSDISAKIKRDCARQPTRATVGRNCGWGSSSQPCPKSQEAAPANAWRTLSSAAESKSGSGLHISWGGFQRVIGFLSLLQPIQLHIDLKVVVRGSDAQLISLDLNIVRPTWSTHPQVLILQ